MNMLERMNSTIEYIEAHLLDELHMPTIAKVAGTSESEIQKTFCVKLFINQCKICKMKYTFAQQSHLGLFQ